MKYTRVNSFTEFDRHLISAVCYFISCKSVDLPCILLSLIKVYHELRTKIKNQPISDLTEIKAKAYRDDILNSEILVMKDIQFELDIELPYKYIDEYRRIFIKRNHLFEQPDKIDKVINCSMRCCNDSYATMMSLYYHPLIIACCCIMYTLQYLKVVVKDDNNIPWFKWLNSLVNISDIQKASHFLNNLYAAAVKPVAPTISVNNSIISAPVEGKKKIEVIDVKTENINSAPMVI